MLEYVASCPRNKPALKCPHNLCHYQKCHNIPDATCLLDTCGVCKAKFYLNGADVTDQCGNYIISTFQVAI